MKTTFDAVTKTFTTSSTAGNLSYSLEGLPEDIMLKLALHGLKQKIGDAAAIKRDTETGKSATDKEKLEAMTKVWDSLRAGEWGIVRTGEGVSKFGYLVRAVAQKFGKSLEEAQAAIAKKDKKEQAAMRANPAIAAIIEELKAQDDKAGANAMPDDALASLFGDEESPEEPEAATRKPAKARK